MKYKLNGFDEYREKLFNNEPIEKAEVDYLIKQLTRFITNKKRIDKSKLRIKIHKKEVIIVTSEKWNGHKIAQIEDAIQAHCTQKDGGYYRFIFLRNNDFEKVKPKHHLRNKKNEDDIRTIKITLKTLRQNLNILKNNDNIQNETIHLLENEIASINNKIDMIDVDIDISSIAEYIQNIISRIEILEADIVTQEDIANIQNEIDNKADLNHNHISTDITNFSEAVDNDINILLNNLTDNIKQI